MMEALTLDIPQRQWQVRDKADAAACALADRHYSRRRKGSGQIGAPGRVLVFVTPCERAVWLTYWPFADRASDGLDAWRCTLFRNEGAGRSSDLVRAAMLLTAELWLAGRVRYVPPRDGWVTWIDTTRVRRKRDPGRCFLRAGWCVDTGWTHRKLVRLRADA